MSKYLTEQITTELVRQNAEGIAERRFPGLYDQRNEKTIEWSLAVQRCKEESVEYLFNNSIPIASARIRWALLRFVATIKIEIRRDVNRVVGVFKGINKKRH